MRLTVLGLATRAVAVLDTAQHSLLHSLKIESEGDSQRFKALVNASTRKGNSLLASRILLREQGDNTTLIVVVPVVVKDELVVLQNVWSIPSDCLLIDHRCVGRGGLTVFHDVVSLIGRGRARGSSLRALCASAGQLQFSEINGREGPEKGK